jgi:hypothetical protein
VDTTRKKLMMENANERSYLNYTMKNDSILLVDGNFFGDTLNLELKKIDLKKLPLLQNEFHWTIDQ